MVNEYLDYLWELWKLPVYMIVVLVVLCPRSTTVWLSQESGDLQDSPPDHQGLLATRSKGDDDAHYLVPTCLCGMIRHVNSRKESKDIF